MIEEDRLLSGENQANEDIKIKSVNKNKLTANFHIV